MKIKLKESQFGKNYGALVDGIPKVVSNFGVIPEDIILCSILTGSSLLSLAVRMMVVIKATFCFPYWVYTKHFLSKVLILRWLSLFQKGLRAV